MMGMPRFRRRGGKEEGGTLLGILLGLALGAILAFGIAWWFTRNAPFPGQTSAEKNQGTPAGTTPAETKFDFYKVLPEGWNGNDGKTQKPAEPPKAAETKTPPQPATVVPTPPVTPQVAAIAPEPPKPQGTERLYWQIGAFATEKEASRVRAELAMAGITSTVEPAGCPMVVRSTGCAPAPTAVRMRRRRRGPGCWRRVMPRRWSNEERRGR